MNAIPNYDATAGNKVINTAIKAIVKSQDTNNKRVATVMTLIALHSERTNDCSGFARLLNALPAGLARNASVIISTMEEYTPIMARKSPEGFSSKLAPRGSEKFKPYDLEGLRDNPWYLRQEAQNDPALVTVDSIGDKLLKLADSITRKIKKGEAEATEVTALTVMAGNIRAFAKTLVPTVIPAAMVPANGNAETPPAALSA